MKPDSNIQYIGGIGPSKAAQLAKLGIYTIRDLVEYYPRRYEDRSQIKKIAALTAGQTEAFQGIIINIRESRPRRGLSILRINVRDDTGVADLVWFNQSYLKKKYKVGQEALSFGKIERFAGKLQVNNPELEVLDGAEGISTAILPVYSCGDSFSQKMFRQFVRAGLDAIPFAETLPSGVLEEYRLLPKDKALQAIHFPAANECIEQARRRLAFEELFFLQYGLLCIRQTNKQFLGIKHAPDSELVQNFQQKIPFEFTNDQLTVIKEIKSDMEDTKPMQRLVQGDVGSGKTVVAGVALVKTVENGYQGAMMAPTEILAEQHYQTLSRLMAPLGIRLAVLTGKLTRRTREEVLERLKHGTVDLVIGTHALIEADVAFKQLGLVVTDEQHRFGVSQRAKLQAKGKMPDVLVMTATPIPRTMALTVYGDLDVSLIRQLPPGRKPIKTLYYNSRKRQEVYQGILREIEKGRQAYVVCPLVEDSDKSDLQSATGLYEELTDTYFRETPCGLLHGRMKPQEKDAVMSAFYQGELKILIATTVIEVGVNVPNATIMVIEDAERFGLSQLHQLRGRIGRGEHQSYCVLLSDAVNSEARERLRLMTQISDGFTLAEKDLMLRGPGQFFGTRQHGIPDLKIADILKDTDILIEARKAAQKAIAAPETAKSVREQLKQVFGGQFAMILNC